MHALNACFISMIINLTRNLQPSYYFDTSSLNLCSISINLMCYFLVKIYSEKTNKKHYWKSKIVPKKCKMIKVIKIIFLFNFWICIIQYIIFLKSKFVGTGLCHPLYCSTYDECNTVRTARADYLVNKPVLWQLSDQLTLGTEVRKRKNNI